MCVRCHKLDGTCTHFHQNTCHGGPQIIIAHGKKDLLIAVARTEDGISKEVVSSAEGSFGKLSGFSPITLYLPLSLVISTAKCLSIVKASG